MLLFDIDCKILFTVKSVDLFLVTCYIWQWSTQIFFSYCWQSTKVIVQHQMSMQSSFQPSWVDKGNLYFDLKASWIRTFSYHYIFCTSFLYFLPPNFRFSHPALTFCKIIQYNFSVCFLRHFFHSTVFWSSSFLPAQNFQPKKVDFLILLVLCTLKFLFYTVFNHPSFLLPI